MKIESIQALLSEHGFNRACSILAHEISAARLDASLNYAAMAEPVYVAAGPGRRGVTAATCYARHALFVLAGKYDSDVLTGRPTLILNGVQPDIVERAHALRRTGGLTNEKA